VIGGPIGCELGKLFFRLGCEVTIIASRDHLLPKEDPEAVEVVHKQFELKASAFSSKLKLSMKSLIAKNLWAGGQKVVVDEILVAAGRQPNVESLNLDAVKLAN